jgi:hypothetical protein
MPTYLLIRPASFGYNIETAASNSYQHFPEPRELDLVQQKACEEFDGLVQALKAAEVEVLILDDKEEPRKTCAVFPNNWFSTHSGGKLVLYPMLSKNRRLERCPEFIELLQRQFQVDELIDLSHFEAQEQFLEGTGSLVLDRVNKLAYACLSPRTHTEPLLYWAAETGYELVPFRAVDAAGQPIYHTNVMMWVGQELAGICLDSISNVLERKDVEQRLRQTRHQLVEFTREQLNRFCGNMLEVQNRHGRSCLVMSEAALKALTPFQREQIEEKSTIISAPIPTIESIGGGSARCMIAEVVLEKNSTKLTADRSIHEVTGVTDVYE